MNQTHNPIIGFTLLDENCHVISPPDRRIDPVFGSRELALEAAERFGRLHEVHKVGELYLEGTFNVVIWDEGDLIFDGGAAKRFARACKIRGLHLSKKARKQIDPKCTENRYSCRQLFGDIDSNRMILLKEDSI